MKSSNNDKKPNGPLFNGRGFCAFVRKNKPHHIESADVKGFSNVWQKASVCWVDYVVENFNREAKGAAAYLGFSESLLNSLLKNKRSGYEDLKTEMGILLPAITAKGFDVKLTPVLILIKENIIVTLHTKEISRFFRIRRYAETFMRKLPTRLLKQDKITLLLIRLIDENNSRNFEHLLEIEEQGDKLSEILSDSSTSRDIIGKQIHKMKHALITYLGGLWATVDALNSVRYGDADLLTDDPHIINRVTALVTEVNSHIGLAEHLSEVLASGLEVLQSIYNNQLQILNNRLALLVSYLTIIGTALLVPNTIATVLSGPMFHMESDDIGWYIPLLVISTVVSTFIAWYAVRKMGLLPKNPDAR